MQTLEVTLDNITHTYTQAREREISTKPRDTHQMDP